MKFHYRMFSRRVILGTAAVLAVTGATGAAAVLAPSDLGLSRLVPNVTAQLVSPETTNDVTQLPFDRIAQAPIATRAGSNRAEGAIAADGCTPGAKGGGTWPYFSTSMSKAWVGSFTLMQTVWE